MAISKVVVEKFCGLCNWTYQAWCIHKFLYDENPNVDTLMKSKHGHFLSRLSHITQEYSLHQIAKIHDPAVQRNEINLTLEYIVKYGGWNAEISEKLESLKNDLDKFGKNLSSARNKVLSHNDLASIIEDQTHSPFVKGADDDYFARLQEFVDMVHNEVIGGPFPFDDLAAADTKLLAIDIYEKTH